METWNIDNTGYKRFSRNFLKGFVPEKSTLVSLFNRVPALQEFLSSLDLDEVVKRLFIKFITSIMRYLSLST